MLKTHISSFKNGWIIGDFFPSLFQSKELEIGHLKLKAGEKADGHFHKKHTEFNYIIRGKAKIEQEVFGDGDFFIYEPYDKANVEYLEDTDLLVIKTPAVKNDKFY